MRVVSVPAFAGTPVSVARANAPRSIMVTRAQAEVRSAHCGALRQSDSGKPTRSFVPALKARADSMLFCTVLGVQTGSDGTHQGAPERLQGLCCTLRALACEHSTCGCLPVSLAISVHM